MPVPANRANYFISGVLVLLILLLESVSGAPDFTHPNDTLTKFAFGSCHNARKIHSKNGSIWKTIREEEPQLFVWTGDAVYPPMRKVATVETMRDLFLDMQTNQTIGYAGWEPPLGFVGTWDDHDFGGNDKGKEMPNKRERAQAFYDFLQLPPIQHRQGIYYSVTVGEPPRQTKIILLDTRWNRGKHCIPSVATNIKLGAGISAVIRWMLAGFNVNSWWPFWDCWYTPILGDEQWKWLEAELKNSQAQIHVVVSSIQVLTTNPTVESWGHFPHERERLLSLLGQGIPGLVVLSGDVHHAEILDPTAAFTTPKSSFLEVTSSGLTHFCSQPFYGFMCRPLLEHYNRHRHPTNNLEDKTANIYVGKNYGTMLIDWEEQSLQVLVKNEFGSGVLSTGPRPFHRERLTTDELDQIPACVDGHMVEPFVKVVMAVLTLLLIRSTGLFFSR